MGAQVGRAREDAVSKEPTSQLGELPREVFEKFVAALEGAGIPAEARERLRKTLLMDKKFADPARRLAVFGEEEGQ